MINNASKIKYSFRNLQPRETWAFRDIGRREINAFTHDYHRYPAKFIPQLVKGLIEKYSEVGELVFDPFGGCGTTMLEARLSGRKSIGFDINLVAELIANTKIQAIYPGKLDQAYEVFLKMYKKAGSYKYIDYSGRLEYWFDHQTFVELTRIYRAIITIPEKYERRFFLCAFSHILKNSSRWLMSSIKPQIDSKKIIPDTFEIFKRKLSSMFKKNELYYTELKRMGRLSLSAQFKHRDATLKYPSSMHGMVDLVVTSPPYVTSYEYSDLHQLTLFWLQADTRQAHGLSGFDIVHDKFRRRFVGTKLKKNSVHDEIGSSIAESIVRDLKSEGLTSTANEVHNYFADMYKAFCAMRGGLRNGGKACVIIGNTSIKGVPILNAEVAAEQLYSIGMNKVSNIKREIVNKMITPWRDLDTGKFTGISNKRKIRAYAHEYIVIVQK